MGSLKGKTLIRVCYVCHKEYEWTAGEANQASNYRRCADCAKLPNGSIKWSCPCGQVYTSRTKYYEHRKQMKESGKYCGLQKDKSEFQCPYCGKIIGTSKNKTETLKECLANHRCEKMVMYKFNSFSNYFTFLGVLSRGERTDFARANTDTTYELIWLKGVLEKLGFGDYILIHPEDGTTSPQFMHSFIKELETVIMFDAPETDEHLYRALEWKVINIKWSDCILHTEDIENQIKAGLESQKEKISQGETSFNQSVAKNLLNQSVVSAVNCWKKK